MRRRSAQLAEFPFLYENVFGTSQTVSVNAAYALTIRVRDALTGTPIADAIVTANTTSIATDKTGAVSFETLSPGTYTVEIKHPSYWGKKFSVTLTGAGEVKEVSLTPLWGIGLGIAGAGTVLTLIITKALKWW